MDVTTTPSANNQALTPPKTHSPNKWLANHDNLAKRVKTYASPAPAPISDTLKEAALSQTEPDFDADSVMPAIPQFDFSPIDTVQHEIPPSAVSLPHSAQGSSLNELIQGNFGSGAGSSIHLNGHADRDGPLEVSVSADLGEPSGSIVPSNADLSSQAHIGKSENIPETSTGSHAERQESVGTSVASDVTVPNTFDSLFKDNLEYTMPEDTMRASLLNNPHILTLGHADVLPDPLATTDVSGSNLQRSDLVEQDVTRLDSGDEQSLTPVRIPAQAQSQDDDRTTILRNQEPSSGPNDSLTAVTSPDNELAEVVDEAHEKAHEAISSVKPSPTISHTQHSEEVHNDGKTTEDDKTVASPSQMDEEPAEIPSTPIRMRPAQLPKTAPRPSRASKTPPPKKASKAPMTEPRRARKAAKPSSVAVDASGKVGAIAVTKESLEAEPEHTNDHKITTESSGPSSPQVTTADTFKTPGKTSRAHSVSESTTKDNIEHGQLPSSPSKENHTNSAARGPKQDDILSTPHSQGLGSAKRSIRRSSQRITSAPVATPQPTPTKSAAKASSEETGVHFTEDTSASVATPVVSRSSRSRRADAPASVPKDTSSITRIASSPIRGSIRKPGVDQPRQLAAELQDLRPEAIPDSQQGISSSPISSRRSKRNVAASNDVKSGGSTSKNKVVEAESQSPSTTDKNTRKRGHAPTESNEGHSAIADTTGSSTAEASITRKAKRPRTNDTEKSEVVAKRSSRAKEPKSSDAAEPVASRRSGRARAVSEIHEPTTATSEPDQPEARVVASKAVRGKKAPKESELATVEESKPSDTRPSRRSKRAPSPAAPKVASTRGSKRKADDDAEPVVVTKGEPASKKTRASQAEVEAPESKKTTRATKEKVKNAIVASPKTTRGTARVSTRSTRAKK